MRVSFATNDERTAKRVSDALGTATELRAMKNYAGHRLSPWLGHLMVSRQETARPLLTPGEVMQLPPADEIVMVAGYAADPGEEGALLRGRAASGAHPAAARLAANCGAVGRLDNWSATAPAEAAGALPAEPRKPEDAANGGVRREPELPEHVAIARETTGLPRRKNSRVIDDEIRKTPRGRPGSCASRCAGSRARSRSIPTMASRCEGRPCATE